MSEELYKVILLGYTKGKGEYYIEQDFAELFKIELSEAKQIFKNLPAKIKESLPLAEAEKYKELIEKTGAECELESMRFDFSNLSLE